MNFKGIGMASGSTQKMKLLELQQIMYPSGDWGYIDSVPRRTANVKIQNKEWNGTKWKIFPILDPDLEMA
jgi:hypothetical protein